jgi:protein gp37
MKPDWVLEIRGQCRKAAVPFFFKQWGGFNKKASGRLLEGRTWDEMPIQAPLAMNLPSDGTTMVTW